jgi:hypothetical protein
MWCTKACSPTRDLGRPARVRCGARFGRADHGQATKASRIMSAMSASGLLVA